MDPRTGLVSRFWQKVIQMPSPARRIVAGADAKRCGVVDHGLDPLANAVLRCIPDRRMMAAATLFILNFSYANGTSGQVWPLI